MIRTYSFWNKLKKSEAPEIVERIKMILKNEFRADKVEKNGVTGVNDLGIDYFVYREGKSLNIDVKVRDMDNWYKDIALETWSNIEHQKIGWSRDHTKKTDYVMWLWNDDHYLINFRKLCDIFSENWEKWITEYKTAVQKTPINDRDDYYYSQCVFIPIIKIEEELKWYDFFYMN